MPAARVTSQRSTLSSSVACASVSVVPSCVTDDAQLKQVGSDACLVSSTDNGGVTTTVTAFTDHQASDSGAQQSTGDDVRALDVEDRRETDAELTTH